MGSPGVFIHSGILGGRLSAFSLAPTASLPARPPARTAPPINAPLLRRKRRRDVTAGSLSTSVGSVIVHPPFESEIDSSRYFKREASAASEHLNYVSRLVPLSRQRRASAI